MKKRIKLAITSAVEKFAKSNGAYFHKADNAWYVDQNVPPELEEFVVPEIRRRQFHAEGAPQCNLCGCNMFLKSTRRSTEFWSCSRFPACSGMKPYDTDAFEHVSKLTTPIRPPEAKTRTLSKKTIPVDVRTRIEQITVRAEELFGHPGAAMRRLAMPKVSLNGVTPIEAITNLAGCAAVDQLLAECFG